jgi:Putative porin
MFIKKFVARAAGLGLAVIVSLAAQPVRAESDSERLAKLEKAVTQLQKENTELKKEVSSLKKQTAEPGIPAEGPTRKQVTYDGKTYVEKSVPIEKSSADKWKLFDGLTELELYGDARVRYEYRGGRLPDDGRNPNDWYERKRERYRLRIGLKGTLVDDWFFGVRLETSSNPRSTNVTFGDDSGPFGKSSDGAYVGQVYLGYKGIPGVTLIAGKMPNPFVNTLMVWDGDLNPEGLAEQWKHSFTIGGGEAAPVTYSKDGTALPGAAPSEPILKIDLFANFGQFVYDDANPENPIGPRPTTTANGPNQLVPNNDAFLLGWQVGARFNFPKKFYFQLAPTVYDYTGNGDSFNVHFQGDIAATNQTGINSLLVFDIPAEFGWKVGNLPMRAFGDFAVNLDGDDRAMAAGHSGKGDQRYAYQAGVSVGQLKKKNNWQLNAFWQHTDQYALDPNMVDSDIFDGRVNMEGVVLQGGYMLTDAVSVNLTYAYAWRIDDALGTGGTGDLSINPVDKYQLFQADLNFKF